MMNKPGVLDVEIDLSALLTEAAHRIRFATEMLARIEEAPAGEGFGGYEFAVVREVLEDVAGTLKAAADKT